MSRRRRRDETGVTLVEVLVVLVLTGVLATAATGIIMSATRTEQFTDELQQVMDDGRISLDNIRRELRGGRRVYADSTPHYLHWWTDRNQDGLQQAEEKINYCVAPLGSTTCVTSTQTGKFQLIRWSEAEAQSAARSIAQTLVTTDVFAGYAADVTQTRVVEIAFLLDVQTGGRGPQEITMDASVRLRNVA